MIKNDIRPIASIYYFLKPFLPRWLQILFRRRYAKFLVFKKKDWLIPKKARTAPTYFSGWPLKKRFAFVITHDVDTRYGYEHVYRLLELDREMGFLSSFNFVPESRYKVDLGTIQHIQKAGYEIGVHGLNHDGKNYLHEKRFLNCRQRINHYLELWGSVGFFAPSLNSNLMWYHLLNIEYDSSTINVDPFEPHLAGVEMIFPFMVTCPTANKSYVEIPITLPQDFSVFILLKEKDITLWEKKARWLIERGALVHLRSHPDYMNFENVRNKGLYPVSNYIDFLNFIKTNYAGQYWNVVPKDLSLFWKKCYKKQ